MLAQNSFKFDRRCAKKILNTESASHRKPVPARLGKKVADLQGETGKELIGGHVVANDSCHFGMRHMHLINGLHHLENDLHGYFLDS